ncbi:hypothetical protein NDU88_010190 [Pleurodeles waltl]|uniref:Uncharacterized protein n=1 Tax=Pleurodeles waltl TaxID=8319 RepID=A0AAV7QV05_PLEWA|nr:hypothetical protein NDU88_010190 [Pleurodeles waltl]
MRVRGKQEKSKDYFDRVKSVKDLEVEPGDWVLVKKPMKNNKGDSKFSHRSRLRKSLEERSAYRGDGVVFLILCMLLWGLEFCGCYGDWESQFMECGWESGCCLLRVPAVGLLC